MERTRTPVGTPGWLWVNLAAMGFSLGHAVALPVAAVLSFAKTPPCSVEEKFMKAYESASSRSTEFRTVGTGKRKAGPLWEGEVSEGTRLDD